MKKIKYLDGLTCQGIKVDESVGLIHVVESQFLVLHNLVFSRRVSRFDSGSC